MQSSSFFQTPNLFPSRNVVYVDRDYKKLRSKGLIAFDNVQEAIEAWDAGGVARAKFGTPTATSQATILCGAGLVYARKLNPANSPIEVYTDYINIVGLGIDATVIGLGTGRTTSSGVAFFRFRVAHFSVRNCTLYLSISGGSEGGISLASVASYGIIENVKFVTDVANGYHFNTGGVDFSGIIRNCIFDTSNATVGNYQPLQIGGGGSDTFNGIIDGCKFILGTSTHYAIYFDVSLAAGSVQGSVSNCYFEGSPLVAFIRGGDDNAFGEISNCYFRCEIAGIPAILHPGSGFISDCTFQMRGACIYVPSGLAVNRLRIMNCYMLTYGDNQNCIHLISATGTFYLCGNRIISNGTGLAIYSDSAVNAEITHCTMRKPTGGGAGSSISSNITNIASGGGSSNEEVESTTSY